VIAATVAEKLIWLDDPGLTGATTVPCVMEQSEVAMKPGHPFETDELDHLRAEQRRNLRAIPE
jgi:hypothetical protein